MLHLKDILKTSLKCLLEVCVVHLFLSIVVPPCKRHEICWDSCRIKSWDSRTTRGSLYFLL